MKANEDQLAIWGGSWERRGKRGFKSNTAAKLLQGGGRRDEEIKKT